MNERIIKDVCIKCNKCGRDIKFKVHYDFNNDNKYIKSRLDDLITGHFFLRYCNIK